MSLLHKSLLAFGLLLASVLAPSGTALAANNSELQTLIRTCELQDGYACGSLGALYVTGQYVTQNYNKAAEYYAKGCELQDGLACAGLGVLYFEGNGVPKNNAKAAEYYAKGCELQDGMACGGLGWLHANGNGTPID